MAEMNPLGLWAPAPKQEKRLIASGSGSMPPRLAGKGRLSFDTAGSALASGMSMLFPFAQGQFSTDYKLDVRSIERLSITKMMELLATYSPDISRALWDFLRLSNPGWEANAYRTRGGSRIYVRAQDELNAFIGRMNDFHGSVDVVFNRLFMSAFLRGSLFGELVLDLSGRTAIDIATPDPASIAFRKVPDDERGEVWQLGQWQGGEFVVLDSPTIRYVPVDPLPGNPYGRSMASPALFTSLFLLGMLHDLRRVVAQQGYPRPDISIDTEKLRSTMPANDAKDPQKFIEWANAVIEQVSSAYGALEPDDAYIHTDVVTHNRPVGTVDSFSLSGLEGLVRVLERMAVRALKTTDLVFGNSSGVSEANANRQWEIFAAGIKSLQHLCEQLLERMFSLALQAAGIEATVEFRFAEMRAAELLRDAQVEAFKIKNARAKYDNGWISQDEAAQEGADKDEADVPEPRSEPQSAGNALPSGGMAADPGSERGNQPPPSFDREIEIRAHEGPAN